MNDAPASAQASTSASVRTVPAPTRGTPSATNVAMTFTASGTVIVTSMPATVVWEKPRPRLSAVCGLSVRSTAITPRPVGGRRSMVPEYASGDMTAAPKLGKAARGGPNISAGPRSEKSVIVLAFRLDPGHDEISYMTSCRQGRTISAHPAVTGQAPAEGQSVAEQ